jgi:hypothetical protein
LFYAIVLYADKELDNYMETFYIRRGGTLQEVMLFHPEYYRSLSVRMYNFEGKEVTPENTMVISYQERSLPDGTSYKEVTSAESFTTYEEAEAFVLSQSSGNYHVVGTDPFISPVPLEALEGYQLVYSSKGWMYEPVVGIVPQVKIFEYTR